MLSPDLPDGPQSSSSRQRQLEVPCCRLTYQTTPKAAAVDRGRWRSLAVVLPTRRLPKQQQQTEADGGPLLSSYLSDGPQSSSSRQRQVEVPCCRLTYQTAPKAAAAADRGRWRSLAVALPTRRPPKQQQQQTEADGGHLPPPDTPDDTESTE